MKLKRLISAAGAALLAISAIPVNTAFADQPQSVNDILTDGAFEYVNVEGGYKITKCTATIITEIPALRNGVPIVEIGENAFAGFNGITDLTIPDSVKTIGAKAFYGCTSAKTITLPRNIKSIGDGAFVGCTGVESITLPDSLTEVGDNAFRKCDHVKEVKFGDNISKVGDYAFYECTSLEKLELPASLSEIGELAFGELLSLNEITVGKSENFAVDEGILTSKDKKEIYCAVSTLSGSLTIPEGTAVIKSGAFSAAAAVEEVFLPKSLSTIENGAFSCQFTGELGYCSLLKKVKFSNGLQTIGDNAFAYTSIESLDLPATLTSIGNSAFKGCYALGKVIIPDGVESIGDKAFLACDKLNSVSVPKSVRSIGEEAFGYTVDYTGETNEDGTKAVDIVKKSGFKMSVSSGSEAKKYAKDNDISYTVKDRNLLKMAFIVLCIALLAAAVVFGLVLMSRNRKTATLAQKKVKKIEKEKAEEAAYKTIIDDSKDINNSEK